MNTVTGVLTIDFKFTDATAYGTFYILVTAYEEYGCYNASKETQITINTPVIRNSLREETEYHEIEAGEWLLMPLDLHSMFLEPDIGDELSLQASFTNCDWLQLAGN